MIKLYDWQQPESDHLVSVLGRYPVGIIGSDTGTGKTVITLDICRRLGWSPLVIAPKAILTQWRETAVLAGVDLSAINVEMLKTGKTPHLRKLTRRAYEWAMPQGTPIICDEAHRFGGEKSENAHLLAMAAYQGHPIIMASATLATSPLRMRAIGYLLRWFDWDDYRSWCLKNGCHVSPFGRTLEFTKSLRRREAILQNIHNAIYPEYGHRLRIADIPNFPENQVLVESFDLGAEAEKIQAFYDEGELRVKEHESPMVAYLFARQYSELQKIPLLLELAQDLLDEGKSVAVFVNFRESIAQLMRGAANLAVDGPCEAHCILGEQSEEERETAKKKFQSGECRFLAITKDAGGVGLSLGDESGNHPRATLICPPLEAEAFRQVVGRCARANSKSKTTQLVVMAAGTVEEKVKKSLRRKLENLDLLNDGDMTGVEL